MAIFKNFFSLFLVFLHLACFSFTSTRKRTKPTSSPLSLHSTSNSHSRLKLIKSHRAFSFLKHIFSSHSSKAVAQPGRTHPNPSIGSPCSSTRSLRHSSIFSVIPNHAFADDPEYPTRKTAGSIPDSEFSSDTVRNDIYPCQICGEIFQRPSVLEQHQSTRHAVSELVDGDSGKNIVLIIFNSGWTNRIKEPIIYRILKIHNGSRSLNRFEEYRESVKSKASRHGGTCRRDERCIADGNELLRFHCTTFLCDLGQNGNSSICNQQYCSVCGIIKSGFSSKLDGIATVSTSWRAHVAIPEDIEEEFSFLNLKRAMLVCRVIAGRVGCDPAVADKEDPGYDSLMGPGRVGEEDELLVYNPRAVLPCFVIVYTV
ncbi:hypothetical protein DCAR_0206629 [Daucus carota subsp. sativus]|uniref:Uncharacterized protein n=1 Tax=Daucus carota subsp. sativus TaxID=79200 RepID=A0A161Y6M6_DAUCS|nr:PREDICTED: uncharacterized protein LOC108206290 [Daucus carota subsp. sativus]WOG87405.1 hypothetical protein DCAR_0206629 [Daucus carota subsp. sativus]